MSEAQRRLAAIVAIDVAGYSRISPPTLLVLHIYLERGVMELLERLGLEPGSFDGRVAVVTGAARGIGEQVARALAHLGAYTIILDILESGEEVASQIRGNTRSADTNKRLINRLFGAVPQGWQANRFGWPA